MEVFKIQRLYVAYGSNMNLEQMEKRCPTATLVGVGVIKNYSLIFRGVPNSYATIEKDFGQEVPVLVWDIQPQDEVNLDEYETYPKLYRKEDIKVELESETVTGMVYIMNDMPIALPDDEYYYGIIDGYKANNIDTKPMELALDKTKKLLGE